MRPKRPSSSTVESGTWFTGSACRRYSPLFPRQQVDQNAAKRCRGKHVVRTTCHVSEASLGGRMRHRSRPSQGHGGRSSLVLPPLCLPDHILVVPSRHLRKASGQASGRLMHMGRGRGECVLLSWRSRSGRDVVCSRGGRSPLPCPMRIVLELPYVARGRVTGAGWRWTNHPELLGSSELARPTHSWARATGCHGHVGRCHPPVSSR